MTARTPFHACGLAWDEDATLAVATYEMMSSSSGNSGSTRHGCAVFYRFDVDTESLELVSRSPDIGGVYDLAWTDGDHVACATGDGRVVLVHRSGRICWETRSENTVYTGIEFDAESGTFLVSEQSGSVSVHSSDRHLVERWEAHSYAESVPAEVWCATRRRNSVLTGADDCVAKVWDLRCLHEKEVFQCRGHDSGVTAVSFLSSSPYFVTGSYDCRAATWDSRNPKKPLSTLELKGGVWKFNWIDDRLAVVPTLDAGVSLIDAVAQSSTATLRSRGRDVAFEGEEKGVTYGAACSRAHRSVCASCTFNENRVSIFKMSRFETEDVS